ncbi:MAG TPA: aromatic acid exporter family protein [Pseudonocardiaceae bacterium]|nr:aromatic acid exporter family protein [Pseudonocardiaceae bacterium]
MTTPVVWARRAIAFPGREREVAIQAGKTAVAAVAAWAIAEYLLRFPQPFMAPYAAVFMVNDTVYRSVTTAVQQVAALVAGQLLAFLTILAVGQVDVAIAIAVFVGMMLGRWHRFGNSGYWIGVTALLMLTYGTADNVEYLMQRLVLAGLGALIGVAVNVLLLPPVHLRQGRQAVEALSEEIRRLATELAEHLRTDWSVDQARMWLDRARALDDSARTATRALDRSQESLWLNVRRTVHRDRYATGDSRPALGRLHEIAEQLQHVGEVLVRAPAEEDSGQPRPDADFLHMLADLLDDMATAVTVVPASGSERVTEQVDDDLARVRGHWRKLTRAVREGTTSLPHSWSVQGSLILAVEHALGAVIGDTPSDWR